MVEVDVSVAHIYYDGHCMGGRKGGREGGREGGRKGGREGGKVVQEQGTRQDRYICYLD